MASNHVMYTRLLNNNEIIESNFKLNYFSSMTKKNLGPYAIRECNKFTTRFHTFTLNCKNKSIAKGTYSNYNVEIGLQLCHSHYLEICEPDRYTKYNKENKKAKN